MTKMKQLLLIGGAVCLLILVAGWFLLISPKKGDIKTAQDATTAEQASNSTLQQQILQLTQQQQGLIDKQVELSKIAQRIPSTEQLPSIFRTVSDMGDATGVDVVTISPGAPTATAATVAPVATPAATASASSSTGTTGTTGTTAGTTTAASAGAAPAAYSTDPIALTVQGNYSQMVMFLDKMENLQRLWVVKSISLAPLASAKGQTQYAPDGAVQEADGLTATITGEVYQTSADTTQISTPALQGTTAPVTAASLAPGTTTN